MTEGWRCWRPSLAFSRNRPLAVIGDSISAGLGGRTEPWPVILARIAGLAVTNLAVPGDTTAGALAQAKPIPPSDASVLIEIGGNDRLGDTGARRFERDLKALLDAVCRPGRVVAMFELPLPPLANAFGRVQPREADAHGVILIPKRVLAGVLGAPGATLDGLHLSQAGRIRMASLLGTMIP